MIGSLLPSPSMTGARNRGAVAMDKKRPRSDGTSLAPSLYPVRIDTVIETLVWTDLGTAEQAVRPPAMQDGYLGIRSQGQLKLFIEAVELGDQRLEPLYQGTLADDTMLVVLYSPALYIQGKGSIETTAIPHVSNDRVGEYLSLPVASEELQEAFSESCTFTHKNIVHKDTYERVLETLIHSEYTLLGPADACRMGSVTAVHGFDTDILYSPAMLAWLQSLTGLDLAAPTHPARLWRLDRASYRMLNEERGDRLPHGLDLCICFTTGNPCCVGEEGAVQYIDKGTGEILVRLEPVGNSLHLAYRTEGAARFIRYIPKKSALESPIFWLTITYPVLE